jgi:PleD family two-component response regulator
MSEDKNKDLKAQAPGSADPSPDGAPQAAKKSGSAGSKSQLDGSKPSKPAEPKKPAKPKEAVREADLYPSDEEEGEEDDGEALFDEEDGAADGDAPLEATLAATDTSERIILVVDEDGQRRNETVAIITQILPNAVIEVANDPEEALGMMEEGDFDTFVVNFLMPGYSSSPFVKAVANHPEHPLLIGFAADKMSDAVDPKKGLKIIPLKRLFDLDTSTTTEAPEGEASED